jgi:hypothetical protein
VVRFTLHDGQTDELLGDAACVGIIKSSLVRSDEEFAEGVSEALTKWLKKRMPHRDQDE